MTCRISPVALWLGSVCVVPGCIEPITVGEETDDAAHDSGDSGGSGGPTAGGPGTDTQTSQTDTGGPGTDTGEPGTDTGEPGTDTGGPCPPIDIAECVECDCIGGEWSCSNANCVYDCTDQACGDACMMCPEQDPECTTPGSEGICTADGQCVGTPPPELGFCEGALEPGFEGDLSVQAGCADVVVYAHDAADERAIVVWVDQGLATDAIASGMSVHAELAATDPAVQLEGRAGVSVTLNECNDVLEPGVDIQETWLPTAGTVIVDVVPDGMGTAHATVELVGVELARVQPGPAPLTVDLTLSDVFVGWLPG